MSRVRSITSGRAGRPAGFPGNYQVSPQAEVVSGHDFTMGAVTGTRVKAHVGCTGLVPVADLIQELEKKGIRTLNHHAAPGPQDLGGELLEIEAPAMTLSKLKELINEAKTAVIRPSWPTPGGTR